MLRENDELLSNLAFYLEKITDDSIEENYRQRLISEFIQYIDVQYIINERTLSRYITEEGLENANTMWHMKTLLEHVVMIETQRTYMLIFNMNEKNISIYEYQGVDKGRESLYSFDTRHSVREIVNTIKTYVNKEEYRRGISS